MKKLLIILIAVISLSGCDRINPKNYPFYCKIDGKEFVPENDTRPIGGVGTEPYDYELSQEDKLFYLRVRNSSTVISMFIFLPNGKLEVGEYELSDDVPNTSYASFRLMNETQDTRSYSQSGWVRITQANENGNFNGEFEFTTYNEYLGKTVKITEGKFRNK
jgi:hypothetical protein